MIKDHDLLQELNHITNISYVLLVTVFSNSGYNMTDNVFLSISKKILSISRSDVEIIYDIIYDIPVYQILASYFLKEYLKQYYKTISERRILIKKSLRHGI